MITIISILGGGLVLSILYSLYSRALLKNEETLRVSAEAQRDALRGAQEALIKQKKVSKKAVRDAVKKAENMDFSTLSTID